VLLEKLGISYGCNSGMERLAEPQVEECRRVFSTFDTTGEGRIGSKDLGVALRALSLSISEEQIRTLVLETDRSTNGVLTFPDFCSLYARLQSQLLTQDKLITALSTFDPSGTGLIQPADLKRALASQGEPLREWEIDEIFRELGVSSEPIDYKSFTRSVFSRN